MEVSTACWCSRDKSRTVHNGYPASKSRRRSSQAPIGAALRQGRDHGALPSPSPVFAPRVLPKPARPTISARVGRFQSLCSQSTGEGKASIATNLSPSSPDGDWVVGDAYLTVSSFLPVYFRVFSRSGLFLLKAGCKPVKLLSRVIFTPLGPTRQTYSPWQDSDSSQRQSPAGEAWHPHTQFQALWRGAAAYSYGKCRGIALAPQYDPQHKRRSK